MTVLLGLLLFSACIDDINRLPTDFPDNKADDFDGDGLTELQGDCNDLDDNVQGPSVWYADTDGDGFGDVNVTTEACQQPTGYVGNSDDCVDSDATIFPDNARYEENGLCVADVDGDGYGDAVPTVSADPGTDCDDTNALVYPGYNEESGNLCIFDADGDGFGQKNAPQPYDSGTDCDDANGDINPDAAESCDGIDNNCSGEIDDYNGSDALRWYADSDGDGYGDATNSIYACDQPPLYVSDSTDCNDGDSSIYPNAPEVCADGDSDGDGVDDAIDNNCNGLADESSAVDAQIWYADGDGDGYGNALTAQPACLQPSGHVADATDCNDNSNAVYPGADEYCNTVDDDCDGAVDEGAAVDAPIWYADLDGDGYGNAVVTQVACAASQGYVASSTDCNDSDLAVNPGANELCATDYDDDCDGTVNEDSAIDPLAFYWDSDSDGFGD
ncbi:MAG: putative metal-binding motif-containing protein, partial [Myxococcota bacterium]|nr:putative metal-binding motif-containing protein [Myxococcota bacterium]